jgi:hypothetical protein
MSNFLTKLTIEKTALQKDGFLIILVAGFADTFYHPSYHLTLLLTCSFSSFLCSLFTLLGA